VAKKSRTPTPPRRPVQAPKVRTGSRDPDALAKQRRLLYMAAGSGVLILVAVMLGIFVLGGGDSAGSTTALGATLRDAGCTFKEKPAIPNVSDHSDVPTLTTKVPYDTVPPAAGPHFGQFAVWNFYEEPVNHRQVVHNLEHGGVALYYGPGVPKEQVDRLKEFYNDDPNGMIATPYAPMKNKIGLAAWSFDIDAVDEKPKGYNGESRVAVCPRFDENAFTEFRDAFRYKGKERFPESQLLPGM